MENLDRLQLNRGKPLAGQIVFAIAETIRSGDTAAGTRLPSIRGLADRLGVNRNTVAQAYKELAEKGYLSARYGGGSFAENPGQALAPGPAGSVAEAIVPETTVPEYGAPFSEGDWEFRYARRVNAFLSGRSHFSSREESSAINLFQLRPNTDLFPLERFRRCMNTVLRRSGRRLLNYGAPTGYLPLREQIAFRLNAQGIRADAGQILITSGSQQAIDLLARAFLDPGDSVVVESPTYAIALKIFTANGARLVPYPIGREGISFAPLNAFQLQPAPKLFYAVPNFQNPTTHSYSLEDKRSLLRQVYRAGSLLIEDAYYAELHEGPRPALAAMDTSGRVIYLNTFSKTLVPAVRVGYLVGPDSVVRKLTELKEMTDLSHSLILQGAVAEFMERGYFDEHVATVRGFYRERTEKAADMLAAVLPPEVEFSRPGGGLFLWVDLPPHVDTGAISTLLREKGVLVPPSDLFQPVQGGRNGIRLCVAGESEQRLARGIALLGVEITRALLRPAPTSLERDYQATH